MQVLTFEKEHKPENISHKTEMIGKLIVYLYETKDTVLLKDTEIERMEIYDKIFVKIYPKNSPMMIFDYSKIEWLKTHHYMHTAKYSKEEAEKLYDMIDGKFDWFSIEDWYIKNKTEYQWRNERGEVTYDKDFIYVNNKSTQLKTSSDMVSFVLSNRSKWY